MERKESETLSEDDVTEQDTKKNTGKRGPKGMKRSTMIDIEGDRELGDVITSLMEEEKKKDKDD